MVTAQEDSDAALGYARPDAGMLATKDFFDPAGTLGFAQQSAAATASNPFYAELGLLSQLEAPRVSGKKDTATRPPPKSLRLGEATFKAVPPLTEAEVAKGEVQGLPAHGKLVMAHSSTAHAGVKEMLMLRKARHEAAIEEYHEKVVQLDVHLEARTGQVARGFKQLMALNDQELATIFEELGDDFLLQMEREEVDDAWRRIEKELSRRERWTTEFEEDLGKVETERRHRVEAELTHLMRLLVETAHLLPPQLERPAEEMTHSVNLLILANREAHAELVSRIKIEEVKRHKADRERWGERLARWRRLRHDQTIANFEAYLHSPQVIVPEKQKELFGQLASVQEEYQQRRLHTLGTLKELGPPSLTEAEAHAVQVALDKLAEEEAQRTQEVLEELGGAEDGLQAEVDSSREYVRARLKYFAAEADEAVDALVEERLQPQVQQRHDDALGLLARVADAAQLQRTELHAEASRLCGKYEAAGRVMDTHAQKSATLYEELRNALASCRDSHEAQDKALEDELDACLTKLRQAADKDQLLECQQKATDLLTQIETAYRSFHSDSLQIVGTHPVKIVEELAALQHNLLETLSIKPREEYEELLRTVQRSEEEADADPEPEAVEGETHEGEEGEEGEENAPAPEPEPEPEPEPYLWPTFGVVFNEKGEAELMLDDELAGLEAANREPEPIDPCVLETASGKVYQYMSDEERAVIDARLEKARAKRIAKEEAAKSKGKKGKSAAPPPPPPPPPVEEPEEEPPAAEEVVPRSVPRTVAGDPCMIELAHPQELTLELCVKLARDCMNYHEQHEVSLPERAGHEAETLKEYLTRELDERLMMHQPRAGHVETDIAHDRKHELLAHGERFARHVKYMTAKLTAHASQMEAEMRAAEAAAATHVQAIAKLGRQLANEKNTHSPSLKRIHREALTAHEVFLHSCSERGAKAREAVNAALQSVVAANAAFRQTWVSFSAGGHFNDEEKQRLSDRLDEVDARAHAEAEQHQAKLVEMEAEQKARVEAALADFEAAYALNMEDVMLLEGLRHRQGAATTEVRILLSQLTMQQTEIDERIAELRAMLPSSGSSPTSDEPLPMRMLKALNHLRKLLLRRAQFLDVLASTGIPRGEIAVALDPDIPGGEDGKSAEAAGEQMPPEPIMKGVYAVREKHEARMVEHCKQYYDKKGEREPTRQALIPLTFEEHKQKLGDALSGLMQRSEDDRMKAIKAFRQQLHTLERQVLNRLGPAVLDDVTNTCRSAVDRTTSKLEAGYRSLSADLVKKRDLHQQSLKPSLRNPSCQPELLALEQAEANRSEAAHRHWTEKRSTLLQAETDMAQTLLRRLVHLPELMLKLLDATVYEVDLIPSEEPPEEIHYALKKKMRMDQREARLARSEDEDAEGRPFSVHVWPGLPLNELTPSAAGVNADQLESDAEKPTTSAELSSIVTKGHRAVIAARDRIYNSYKAYFLERVVELARSSDSALSEERQWKVIWDKLVASAKVGGTA